MTPSPAPGAVLFDLFGTLVLFDEDRLPRVSDGGGSQRPSTLPALQAALGEIAPEVPPEAFAESLRRVSAELAAGHGGERPIEVPSRERFRRALLAAGCSPSRMDRAALRLSRVHLRLLADATTCPAAHRATWDEVARRMPVGIVSNFDDTGTALHVAHRHGLAVAAQCIVISEAVGFRKPHPVVFHAALDELGAVPARTWFVGDSFVEDVGGALGAGLQAVWLDRRGQGPPPGGPPPMHRIAELPDLLALLP